MRRAELALHLPHQVGELQPGGHLPDQREVAVEDQPPVDARHVLGPEVVALEAPGLLEHLHPFAARVDRHLDPVEVEPAAAASGAVVGIGGLLPRLDHPEPPPRPVGQRLPVAGDLELVDAPGEDVVALLGQVVDLEGAPGPGRAGEAVAAEAALDRPGGEEDLALEADDLGVAPLGDGHRHDALGDAVEVDAQWGRAGRLVRLRFLRRLGLLGRRSLLRRRFRGGRLRCRPAHPPRLRHERRRVVSVQGHQVGPDGPGETEVEVQRVVDRVEDPVGQEVQELPVRVPRRVHVAELRPRHEMRGAGGDLAQLDRPGAGGGGEAVGQPPAVGRPHDAVEGAVLGAVEEP